MQWTWELNAPITIEDGCSFNCKFAQDHCSCWFSSGFAIQFLSLGVNKHDQNNDNIRLRKSLGTYIIPSHQIIHILTHEWQTISSTLWLKILHNIVYRFWVKEQYSVIWYNSDAGWIFTGGSTPLTCPKISNLLYVSSKSLIKILTVSCTYDIFHSWIVLIIAG